MTAFPATNRIAPALAAQQAALLRAELGDPFALLGPHDEGDGQLVRCFLPGAVAVELIGWDSAVTLAVAQRIHEAGLFEAHIRCETGYRLRVQWPATTQEIEDPYCFGLLLGDIDLHLLAEGRHRELSRCLGAQLVSVGGVPGVRFAVWAPEARAVSVVGGFNGWDGRRHPMRKRIEAGVWELFIPRLAAGEHYKFELVAADGARLTKADPMALRSELPPGTNSIVADLSRVQWSDGDWLASRARRQAPDAPLSIYEVHAGSWQREDFGRGAPPDWDALAERLVPYAAGLGFTHLELLPVMEHPFGGSWGYQPLAQFAPSTRYGAPEAFARFVDAAHRAGLGVILDWVPAHFPADAHGLRRFDGSALYEHADPREGFHPDWNTLIYNLGRNEVRGFLIASALHWLERYHVDGLRVDAVASMLYRDYSREPGRWIPNAYGGRENLESIAFLRELNDVVHERVPGAVVIAEESTSWPGVTAPTSEGGLGFSYKWNMGWMSDTLHYLAREPVHRKYHHREITFGLMYAFAERFVLPLSHDEVVHLKRSLIGKVPGDDWQRHATLRAYYGLMWGYPGKKLLFMGCEFAQRSEWNHDIELEWSLLTAPLPNGVQRWVGDLNRAYREQPALHERDCDGRGFHWVVVDDAAQSVFAWLRFDAHGAPLLVVCNFTPEPRRAYRIGVPVGGRWRELLNSDAALYGGGDVGNGGVLAADARPSHGQPRSLSLTLPPLATLMLRPEQA